MRPPPRFALTLALALTPDSRPGVRRAVLRGAALVNRSAGNRLSTLDQKRILKYLEGAQRRYAAVGVALYSIALKRLPTLILFAITVVYLLYLVVAAIVTGGK